MLQLIYISTAVSELSTEDRDGILAASRSNNARDGITGMLLFNGRRFLQALEGGQDPVEAAYGRIRRDPRHRAIVLLSRRDIGAREFGDWAMAEPSDAREADALVTQVDRLTANASRTTRAHFMSYAELSGS